jgi:succinoglycan biosynthesis transport protein ExoP
MDSSESIIVASNRPILRTHRDFLAIGFRHRRLIVVSFFGVFLGGLVVALLQPRKYESHLEILVRRERAEPVITPGALQEAPQYDAAVTEQEVNSEVGLLKSQDLLEQVVVACGLDRLQRDSIWARLLDHITPRLSGTNTEALKVSLAMQKLSKKLSISVVPNTNLIAVSYESPDPNLAAQVLRTLASAYLQKHVSLHRSRGAFDFFHQQTNRFAQHLAAAEAELVQFNHDHGVVSAQAQEMATLTKLADFRAALHQTQSQIAAARQRIEVLKQQAASTPRRVATQVVVATNPQLLADLKSALLNLEVQRTQLLMKYAPDYPPVRAVDTQIAEAQAEIAAAEKKRVQQSTTDRDLTYQWEDEELARAKTELGGLQAQASTIEATIHVYETRAQFLGREDVAQGDLTRAISAAKADYLLYREKEEEARINDALDRRRIVNVAIAEAPIIPVLPSNRRSLTIILAGLLACVVSGGLALGAESLDTTFRTPDEVRSFLDVPVIAALPKDTSKASGNVEGGVTE